MMPARNARRKSAGERSLLRYFMGASQMPDEHRRAMAQHLAVFLGGYPLMGSHQSVSDQLARLSDAGLDDVALAWMDYEHGLPDFIGNILPLLESKGLREAFRKDDDPCK